MESGALGARLTGAGFGGCAVVFARKPDIPKLRLGLIEKFYAGCPSFDEKQHLIDAEPGPGVLHP
jgi:galactokinase